MDLIDPKNPLFNKEGWIQAQTSAVQSREEVFLGKDIKGFVKEKIQKLFSSRTRNIIDIKNFVKIDISNKILLTQDHRDLLDIIFRYVKYDKKNNTIIANVPLKEFKKRIGSAKNPDWLKEKLQDLREIVFYMTFTVEKGNKKYRHLTNFNVINFFDKVDRIDVDGKDARENMVHIVIDPGYIIFFTSDVAIDYSSIMNDIISIKDKAVKSVVRYCLSQKQYVHANLFKILKRFGFTDDDFRDRNGRRLKKRFEKAKETLKNFNIEYDKKSNLIKYTKKDNNVYHYVPEGNIFLKNLEKYSMLPHYKKEEIADTKD